VRNSGLVLFLRVVAANDTFEQRHKILILRDPACCSLDGSDIPIAAKFHPFIPDLLVVLAIQELAVPALEEVVDPKNPGQLFCPAAKSTLICRYLPSGMERKSRFDMGLC